MTSSLNRSVSNKQWCRLTWYVLLKLDVSYQVLTALDALGEKDISRGGDCNDVRVLAERLERDRVVNISGGFP